MAGEQGGAVYLRELDLKRFCRLVMERLGVAPDNAQLVAEVLVEADLRGVDSHGVIRLPTYVERMSAGGINPRPVMRTVRETRTTAVLDGGNGMGHLVGRVRAMELAIAKAAEGDCAFVSVRNSNHYGVAAYYAEMAARHDLIGLSFTISGMLLMPPWGGAEAMLGNNPVAVAFPTPGDFPVVLDMACSVARGKILVASKKESVHSSRLGHRSGRPADERDPNEALKGSLLPIVGRRVMDLLLTVGLLCTMLSAAYFGSEISWLHQQKDTARTSATCSESCRSSLSRIATYKQRMGRRSTTSRM